MTELPRGVPRSFSGAPANLVDEDDVVVDQSEGGGTHTGPAFGDFLIGRLPAATGRNITSQVGPHHHADLIRFGGLVRGLRGGKAERLVDAAATGSQLKPIVETGSLGEREFVMAAPEKQRLAFPAGQSRVAFRI